MKSGNLNFLEPFGPLQACNGTALPLPLPCLALQEKELDESSRLDVVEIAHVPDMLPRFFKSWSG